MAASIAEKTPSNTIDIDPDSRPNRTPTDANPDGDGDGEFQEFLFGGRFLHAASLG